MKHDIQQRTVDFESPAVVVDEAEFTELIHEKADSGTSGTHHFCQGFLANLGKDLLRFAVLSKVGHQEQYPCEPFLAGVEEPVDQIFLDSNVAREQIGHEELGEPRLVTDHSDCCWFGYPDDRGIRKGGGGGHAPLLAREATLAEKVGRSQDSDDRFFAVLGNDGELDFALLNVKERIGGIALGENRLILTVGGDDSSFADLGQKGFGIEGRPFRFQKAAPFCSV